MTLENLWGIYFQILDKFSTFPSVNLDRVLMQLLSVMNNLLFSHKIRINPFYILIRKEQSSILSVLITHAIGKSEVMQRKYFESYSNLIFRGFS